MLMISTSKIYNERAKHKSITSTCWTGVNANFGFFLHFSVSDITKMASEKDVSSNFGY